MINKLVLAEIRGACPKFGHMPKAPYLLAEQKRFMQAIFMYKHLFAFETSKLRHGKWL